MKKAKTELKFKKLPYTIVDQNNEEQTVQSNAQIPTRATEHSAGVDLYATRITQETDNSGKLVLVYHTDLAVEIPEGYFGMLAMKSSVSKRSLTLCNAFGTIDSDYRGEVIGKFKVTTDAVPTIYAVGEPFAQLIIVPCAILPIVEAEELSETERDTKGFGEATEAKAKEQENTDKQ